MPYFVFTLLNKSVFRLVDYVYGKDVPLLVSQAGTS